MQLLFIVLWYSTITALGFELLVPIMDESKQLLYNLISVGFLALLEFFVFRFTIMRLHDLGYSGIFSLLNFIPGLLLLFQFILGVLAGKEQENEFGPVPQNRTSLKDTFV